MMHGKTWPRPRVKHSAGIIAKARRRDKISVPFMLAGQFGANTRMMAGHISRRDITTAKKWPDIRDIEVLRSLCDPMSEYVLLVAGAMKARGRRATA